MARIEQLAIMECQTKGISNHLIQKENKPRVFASGALNDTT